MTILPDPNRQTEECKALPKHSDGTPVKCPNVKERDDLNMEAETYECAICGYRYKLYYDDMR